MSISELSEFMQQLHQLFDIATDAEITLEANPDDLSPSYLKGLVGLGFNRLSIGVQSFIDSELKTMNRRHTANEASTAIELIQASGISNYNVDLIYGLPYSTLETWQYSLHKLLAYNVSHISAYHLSYEQGTAFGNYLRRGKLQEVSDTLSEQQYNMLCEATAQSGYNHYEISNFCQAGKHSRHNSSYWHGEPYLGIGPSAHSFDGHNRQWNIAHNRKYLQAITSGKAYYELEELSRRESYNDYLITRLRTSAGINLSNLQSNWPEFSASFLKAANKPSSQLQNSNARMYIAENDMLRSDAIISQFLNIENS